MTPEVGSFRGAVIWEPENLLFYCSESIVGEGSTPVALS